MKVTPQEKTILDAALEVVARETISRTRMHLIAEEAGMSQSNLHYHFKTKDALMKALFCMIQDTFTERRKQDAVDPDTPVESQIAHFFQEPRRLLDEDWRYETVQIDFWLYAHTEPEMQELFDESYEGWREQAIRLIAQAYPEIPAETQRALGYIMVSMFVGAVMQIMNRADFDLDRYFEVCTKLILLELNKLHQAG